MILIDLYGGPGSGKSTAAAALFVCLKNHGARVALVGEAATELILGGQQIVLGSNQALVQSLQYERILRLARAGYKIAINDCPLRMGLAYAKDFDYYNELELLNKKLESHFETYRVYTHRATPMDEVARTAESLRNLPKLDEDIYKLCPSYWAEVPGDSKGQERLCALAEMEFLKRDITY